MTDNDDIEAVPGEAVGSPVDPGDSEANRTVIEFTAEELKQPIKVESASLPTTVLPAVVRHPGAQVLPAISSGGPRGPVPVAVKSGEIWSNVRKGGLGLLAVALVSSGAYYIGQGTRKSDAVVDAQITAIEAAQNRETNGALDKQKTTYARLTRKRADASFKKGQKVGYNKGFSETSSPGAGAVDNAYQSGKTTGYASGYSCGRYSTNCGE